MLKFNHNRLKGMYYGHNNTASENLYSGTT